MATNLELQAELKKKEKEIVELQEQLKEKAKQESKPLSGLSGYVIESPDPKFNGARLGIAFRGGKGIMLDSPTAEATARIFQHDFGYKVTRSENLNQMPETAERMSKSMIDILKA